MYVEDREELEELEEYAGLGFVPAVVATPLVAAGTGAATDLVGGAVNWIGGIFSGQNPDTPPGWEERALTDPTAGHAMGRAQRTPPSVAGQIPPLFPSWREGLNVGPYSRAELEEALAHTPRGTPGEGDLNPGTIEGLVSAIRQQNPSVRVPRNNRELANVAVYVAHGRGDAGVGWREEPTVAHVETILRNYRARKAAEAPALAELMPGLDELPTLEELTSGKGGTVLLALAALGTVAALLAPRR
ncbi:MAG: hypothetical protein AB7N73_14975 [Gemmatimonadales bacterium]